MSACWRSTKTFDDRLISSGRSLPACRRGCETIRRQASRRNGPAAVAVYTDCLESIKRIGGGGMTKIDERTAANMDVVLDEICSNLPHGGDHESRKYVAKKVMQSVKKGNGTLEGLRPVASRALSELSKRKSA
jgi:hypothetical protein